MRWLLLTVLAVSLAALCVPDALAHGGSYGHGYRGPVYAPSIPCDCAKAACTACSAPGLVDGAGLSKRETKIEILETWGDIARVRTTTEIETAQAYRFLEAFAEIEVAPLLAVTAGRVESSGHALVGVRAPSVEARRDYLWERNWSLKDPLLVYRHDAKTVHVRVFPIKQEAPTTVVLEGFTLSAARATQARRLYRAGDTYLLVTPVGKALHWLPVDFWDRAGGRALQVLDRRGARKWLPDLVEQAREVPGLPALLGAILAASPAAVTDDTMLVAVTPGRRAPKNLFIGKATDAPIIRAGGPPVPPGQREPTDPAPPPPLPPTPPSTPQPAEPAEDPTPPPPPQG